MYHKIDNPEQCHVSTHVYAIFQFFLILPPTHKEIVKLTALEHLTLISL